MKQISPLHIWDIYDMNTGNVLNRRPYVLLWQTVDDVMYIKCYHNLYKRASRIVKVDLEKMVIKC